MEKKSQFTLNGRMVKGYIDRIERTPNGEYLVVDFKIGSKSGSLTKNSVLADIQLNLSSLAIREIFGRLPQSASFYYIKDGRWLIIS